MVSEIRINNKNMTPNRVFKDITKNGKFKIVDNNKFVIATAPDSSENSEETIERLILCYNLLNNFPIETLREMPFFNYKDFK
jgi:hypothetical protein